MFEHGYARFYHRIIYPLSEIRVPRAGKSRRILALLEKSQFWPRDRLARFQLISLRRLLWHAYLNCPYYRRKFDQAGVHPEELVHLEDLQRFPLIDKAEIRQYGSEMAATNYQHQRRLSNTGGSTGEPLRFFVDSVVEKSWAAASAYRGYRWYGYMRGLPMIYFWSSPIDSQKEIHWKVRLFRALAREIYLDAFRLDETRFEQLSALLRRYKGAYVKGYPSALYQYACYLEEKGETVPPPSCVFTTGETLFPAYRSKIAQVLQTTVADFYGQRESNALFFQCPLSREYHVNDEAVVAEIVPVEGSEERLGELVITDLRNLAQPFIRYRTGDLVAPSQSECSCGRSLSLVQHIVGRINETIRLQNGRILVPALFPHLFKDIPQVRQFRIHCHSGQRLIVEIVPQHRLTRQLRQTILKQLKPIIGEGVRLEVKKAQILEPLPSGKTQFVVVNGKKEQNR